jgi:hypothetical protein
MCCSAVIGQSGSRGRANDGSVRTALRLTALVLCVLFAVALLLSTAFIFAHANHEHDHNGENGGCAACSCVASAQTLLKQLLTATAGGVLALSGLFAVIRIIGLTLSHLDSSTLVRLKIRLND